MFATAEIKPSNKQNTTMMPFEDSPPTRSARYVDVRLAITNDAAFPSGNALAGYHGTAHNMPPPAEKMTGNSPSSSYTFVPLDSSHAFNESLSTLCSINEFEESFCSPLDYRKSAISPAFTAATLDSSEHTLNSHRSVTILEEEFCHPVPSLSPISTVISTGGPPYKTTEAMRRARSPFLQNYDSAYREKRAKTELCMHWKQRATCPFGSGCKYAHGKSELQKRLLVDLCAEGLADGETYRTKPCLMWVSTGSW